MTSRRTPRRSAAATSVWEKPHVKALLKQRLGAPIKLTRAEAKAIADAAFGARPDLPPGKKRLQRTKQGLRLL